MLDVLGLSAPLAGVIESAVVAAAMRVAMSSASSREEGVRIVAYEFGMSESSVQRRLRKWRKVGPMIAQYLAVDPLDCFDSFCEEMQVAPSSAAMSSFRDTHGYTEPVDCAV